MTPYGHYPRVSMNRCRCLNCGWTHLEILHDRIWEKKASHMRYVPKPRYVMKRKHGLMMYAKKIGTRKTLVPRYKARRIQAERWEKYFSGKTEVGFTEV